jgi:hypothetical protein
MGHGLWIFRIVSWRRRSSNTDFNMYRCYIVRDSKWDINSRFNADKWLRIVYNNRNAIGSFISCYGYVYGSSKGCGRSNF